MRESGSTFIAIIIILKGVCEQAEHVKGIQRHDEDSNQPMQKYRCSYKTFKWSKHSQKRKKNVSCGSFYNTEAEKCTTVKRSSCSYFT